jgi:hypothetical protein
MKLKYKIHLLLSSKIINRLALRLYALNVISLLFVSFLDMVVLAKGYYIKLPYKEITAAIM